MADDERDLCELSIANAISARKKFSSDPQTPPWLYKLLLRIRDQIPARYPYEVLCLAGVRVSDTFYARSAEVQARWLLQRGWSVDMSLQVWKNFRLMFPTPRFEPETLRILPREGLVAEYGKTFGDLIADVCVDPDNQPVIAALLFNKFDSYIERPMTLAGTAITIDENQLFDRDPNWVCNSQINFDFQMIEVGTFEDMQTVVDKPVTLTADVARRIYARATGAEPRRTFTLNPLEISYEHPEKALR